jgi:tRNA1Val (adenine37-N6)-methyltransferase
VAIEILNEVPNRTFTYSYEQPAEYRFCQDSIIFPWWVAEQLKQRLDVGPNFRVLDVCAGCGVIGLELAHYEPRLSAIDFLEVQGEFRDSFMKNLQITGRSDFRFLQMNYRSLLETQSAETYDLIIGNPPYFLPTEGLQSPSVINNRCRFFIDSDLATLVLATFHALKPGGIAYLLVKSGQEHGRIALNDITLLLAGQAAATVSVAVEIRNTQVICLIK